MNHPNPGRKTALIAFWLCLACAIHAQSPAPATTSDTTTVVNDEGETVVKMSPFIVNTDKDEGFVPASSLAGGRLNTALRDTPVAYSVLTRDFLDALNLPDQEQALTWSVGSYMPIVALSAYRYNDNEGGSSVISRGVQTNAAQRNFFLLGLNADTYSSERIDFARGPNALLIGTGGGLSLREEGLCVLLRPAVQRGLFGAVKLVVDRRAMRRPAWLLKRDLHARLPRWGPRTVSSRAKRRYHPAEGHFRVTGFR